MELERVGSKALAVVKADQKNLVPPKPQKKVLDEDAYTENVEKIIVRDFFPDLPKLEAQNEYLEALQKNDVQKLREIHIKYGPKRPTDTPNIYATPATFETPDIAPRQSPKPTDSDANEDRGSGQVEDDDQPTHNPEPAKKKTEVDLPLDKFLSKVTSEDNASFSEIMKESEEKHKLKHAWLYEQEEEKKQMKEGQLALPGIEQQAITGSNEKVETWEYTNRNSVMYIPDGAQESAKERVEKAKGNPRQIVHQNTRFEQKPFDQQKIAELTAQSAAAQAQMKLGKIGHDGKELMPEQSPQVNGYGFVATPSPAPGVSESPLMTWGEIDGTPFRLDGGGTPLLNRTPGPVFKMPAVPKRDEIAMQLVEKASRAHRAKKEAALKRVSSRLSSPSPKFGAASKTERIQNMSPAAQRLANTRLGIRTHTDKALRASYTPSPSHRLSMSKTPTPTKTPKGSTPRSSLSTPKSLEKTPGSGSTTPKPSTPNSRLSLTDNLLFLPKRPRVEDVSLTPKTSEGGKKPRAEDFF